MGSNPTLSAISAHGLDSQMLALAALLFATAPPVTPGKTCATVSGTYAVYATNDLLHIDHSHHLIVVVSDDLDRQLLKRDGQDVVAKGRFTVCGRYVASPLNWNIHDRVDLVSYRDIRFVPRSDK